MFNEKHKQEAAVHGLEIIKRCDNPNYLLYLLPCGHSQEFQIQHIRRGNFRCLSCQILNYTNECDASGFIFIKKNNKNTLTVKNKICGHVLNLSIQNIRNSKGFCSHCFEQRLHDEAVKVGLIYLDNRGQNNGYRSYRFVDCGHEQVIHHQCIPVGRYECKSCLVDKWKTEASLIGLEYIEKVGKNHKYRLQCGCFKIMDTEAVRTNTRMNCLNCDDTYYSRPSFLYLFKITDSHGCFLKLGFSNNPERRSTQYGTIENKLLLQVPFKSGYDALLVEKRIHNNYRDFKLNPLDLKKRMQSGFTECYPVELEEVLLKDLKEYQ